MPIHIDEVSADIELHAEGLPLSAAQLEQIAEFVLRRLADRTRDAHRSRCADAVHGSALAARGLATRGTG